MAGKSILAQGLEKLPPQHLTLLHYIKNGFNTPKQLAVVNPLQLSNSSATNYQGYLKSLLKHGYVERVKASAPNQSAPFYKYYINPDKIDLEKLEDLTSALDDNSPKVVDEEIINDEDSRDEYIEQDATDGDTTEPSSGNVEMVDTTMLLASFKVTHVRSGLIRRGETKVDVDIKLQVNTNWTDLEILRTAYRVLIDEYIKEDVCNIALISIIELDATE